ncbi:MAG TPA: GWxTD domain-containing protein [Caldithrix abyssi]|uniref:GWxTD domain-containing protein n=1 Tax=Caldithrix abyssi TaxID=187145 RepID=A0A7V4WVZ9_CALAY|nr:GWxTD domain-containing protein [Caldithrix abyssi]
MRWLLLLLSLPLLVLGQIRYIPVYADYASFCSTDSTVYLEIYVSVYQGNLTYLPVKNGIGYEANFSHQVSIIRDGKVVETFQRKYRNATEDTSKVAQYNQFVDIFKAELPYADYSAKIETIDQQSSLRGEYILDIKSIHPTDKIYLSDIEFCSEISRDTTKNTFFKNNLRVVPNPRRVYDILHPLLFYYVELNNLPFEPGMTKGYEFSYTITNTKGDTIKRKAPVQKKIVNNRQAEIGGLNVMALPKDVYFFNITIKDLQTDEISTTRRKFYVFKPTRKKEQAVAANTTLPDIDPIYTDMTHDQLQEEFDMARYIASKKEEHVFDNLENDQAMRKFLTDFWRRKDKEKFLPFGSSRNTYLRYAAYANDNFGYMGKKGWKTDRGRVLMMYGEPDEFERFPNTMNMVPYVIWRYHSLEGGAIFVFADLTGFGEYRLVHSTYRMEIQNPDWQQQIQQGNTREINGFQGF